MARLDCETCQERIVEAFGGELRPREQRDFEDHLDQCPSCAEIWQDYQELHSAVANWAKGQEPRLSTVEKILQASDRRSKPAPRIALHPWWKVLLSPPALAAATLLLIAGVGFYSQHWMETSHPPASSGRPAALPENAAPLAGSKGEAEKAKKPEKELSRAKQDNTVPAPRPATNLGILKESGETTSKDSGDLFQNAVERKIQPPSAPNADLASPLEKASPGGAGMARPTSPTEPAKALGSSLDQDKEKQAVPEGAATSLRAQPEQEEPAKMSKSEKPAPEVEALLKSAKLKIQAKDFDGALKDLQRAQQLKDSKEIQHLIQECRKKSSQAQ